MAAGSERRPWGPARAPPRPEEKEPGASERPGLEGNPAWGRLVTFPTGLWTLPSGPVAPLSSSQAECRIGSFLASNKNFYFFRADGVSGLCRQKKVPLRGHLSFFLNIPGLGADFLFGIESHPINENSAN